MSFQNMLVTVGLVALVVPATSRQFSLVAQYPAMAGEVHGTRIRIEDARNAVGSDQSEIARLEALIDRQRAEIVAAGLGAHPGPDFWDRFFTLDEPKKTLASLETSLAREQRKLVRDLALVDSLEAQRLTVR